MPLRSAIGESANSLGLKISLSPNQAQLPLLADAVEQTNANDFQAKLLRYRQLNWERVRDFQPDPEHLASVLRDEFQAWMAPILDFPELQSAVQDSFSQRIQTMKDVELTDDYCLVAEAALYFCHCEMTLKFSVGELASIVNFLLKGRHEDRVLTDKKVGTILRDLGLHAIRTQKGYELVLNEEVRVKIHSLAQSYKLPPMREGCAGCAHCGSMKPF